MKASRLSRTYFSYGISGILLAAVIVITACDASGQPCTGTPAGIVGWWRGESNFVDEISGASGTPVGNATFGPGEVGNGFIFDGHGDEVLVGNPSALRLQDFTIECWVQRSSLTDVSLDSTSCGFFGYGGGGYLLGMRNDGHPFLTKTDISDVPSTASIADTAFHHVAVTKSGTNVVFYVDGVAYPGPSYNPGFTFTANAGIGSNPDAAGNSFLGTIDEVAVYNRPLASQEIQAIYNAGSSGKCVVHTPPTITVQPTNQAVIAVTNAVFTVLAAGSPPLSYQWSFGTTNLSFGTSYSLTITNVQLSVTGAYQVVITNPYGATTSSVANLTIVSPPVINDQPQDVSVLTGGRATFVVGASGSPPLSFTWQHAGTNLPGALNYALTITNAQLVNTGAYRVVVSNVLGSVTSSVANLILVLPPTITNQPAGLAVPAGANVGFSVGVMGIGPLSYQWRFGVTNVAGATNSNLFLNNVQFSDAGTYSVMASNAAGGIISSNAVLTVSNAVCSAAPTGLVAWWQAEGSAVDAVSGLSGALVGNTAFGTGKVGQSFVFDGQGDVVNVGNPTNLQLQSFTIEAWIQRTTLTNVSVGASSAGFFGYGSGGYIFGILNTGQLFLSKDGISQVNGGLVTDTAFHHVAVTKNATSVIFYVDGAAYTAPAYDPGFTFGTPAGIGGRADNLSASFNGKIDEVAVYNRALSAGEIQSVYYASTQGKCGIAPTITQQPIGQSVVVGSSAVLSAGASGTAPIGYHWELNGATVAGATNTTLAINGVTFYHSGNYRFIASNSVGAATSTVARLTVLPKLLIANGSFESGNFFGWITNDISTPLTPLAVRPAGYNSGFGFFTTAPSDGSYCLTCGFDGNGPGRIRAAVDLQLPAGPILLSFDYRLAWDMQNYSGSTQPRTFAIVIEPFGGGAGVFTNIVYTAAPGTSDYDTGKLSGMMDLSAFAGLGVRVSFDLNIPEAFTGPGFFQLDNVYVAYTPSPTLRIGVSGGDALLVWPSVFTNFIVLSSTNLSAAGSWSSLDTNSIQRSATNNSLADPLTPAPHFYRLRSQ
jgi:hypothetical protein